MTRGSCFRPEAPFAQPSTIIYFILLLYERLLSGEGEGGGWDGGGGGGEGGGQYIMHYTTMEFNRADFTLLRYNRGDGFSFKFVSSFQTFGNANNGSLFNVAQLWAGTGWYLLLLADTKQTLPLIGYSLKGLPGVLLQN